ncbi:long-chain-fatty-acid--CoA ligase [Metabacillus sp. RGM 3146]|uniref:long-chain-fatty-acid--CoA ligase n=1 Tax=Metabacillus sp. RGM 3146 TaxID=3401092 RepID=UPI003B9AE13B
MQDLSQWFSKYPESMLHDINIPSISLSDMLKNAVDKYSENPAISFYGRTMTYSQLSESVSAFASALQGEGLKKGDRAAIMLPNCPQYAVSFFGILTAGGIVTQMNPMLVERELEHILNDSGAEILVVYDVLYERVNAIKEKTNLKKIITVSLQPDSPKQEGAESFEIFLSRGQQQLNEVEIDPENDIAVLQYTGGTTGLSKGAMLTHRNLVANTVQSYEYSKSEVNLGQEKCLTVIPLFHVFAMTSCMNMSLYCGNCMIMLPRFDLEEVLETIRKEQPTIFPGVPTMYVAITNHPRAEEFGLDCIKICNSGSAPMPVELQREFERKTGAKILEGYGLSEASPVTHCNPVFGERKPGSVGLAFPQTACKIVDLATGFEELRPGELGEIIVSGPQVMKGYWNMIEETAHALRDGWLFTGDIGKKDEDGYLYINDRKKDLIIASGYNIYPRDVEEILYEHPSVQEAVVIGVPDPYRGETVKAFIVLKNGKEAEVEEIIQYCKDNMSAYKVPKEIEFRSELPKTNVGKILRRALREEAARKQV